MAQSLHKRKEGVAQVATRQDGLERATAIVAALREECSGEELASRLAAEYRHACRVAVICRDEEWLARVEVYWQALRDEEGKQSA